MNVKGQTYTVAQAPSIVNIYPLEGGINGGTTLTILGAGFSAFEDRIEVPAAIPGPKEPRP